MHFIILYVIIYSAYMKQLNIVVAVHAFKGE